MSIYILFLGAGSSLGPLCAGYIASGKIKPDSMRTQETDAKSQPGDGAGLSGLQSLGWALMCLLSSS